MVDNITRRDRLQLTISGENVSPEMISAYELADYLIHINDAIDAMRDEMEIAIGNEPELALVGIAQGSARLELTLLSSLAVAMGTVTDAIQRNELDALPQKAKNAIQHLYARATNTRHTIRIVAEDADIGIPEAVIRPETSPGELSSIQQVKGITTLYGRCLGVWGERMPRAELQMADGKRMIISLEFRIAKQMASYLYDEVQLEGEATWISPAWELKKFHATNLLPATVVPVDEAFSILRERLGQYWQGVDAELFVNQQRYGEHEL